MSFDEINKVGMREKGAPADPDGESAKALMELVAKLDGDHYKRLCKQCR